MSDEWTDSEGNSLGDWQEITREEYARLFGGEDLTVFSSLTDPEGTFGIRQVYTAWGRQGSDAPLIDIRDYKGEDGRTERQVCRKFVPVSGLPPVDPEVLDRAVEEGRESVRTGMHVNTTQGYQEQEFRAIAAAAYRQGREDGIDEMTEATKEAMGEDVSR